MEGGALRAKRTPSCLGRQRPKERWTAPLGKRPRTQPSGTPGEGRAHSRAREGAPAGRRRGKPAQGRARRRCLDAARATAGTWPARTIAARRPAAHSRTARHPAGPSPSCPGPARAARLVTAGRPSLDAARRPVHKSSPCQTPARAGRSLCAQPELGGARRLRGRSPGCPGHARMPPGPCCAQGLIHGACFLASKCFITCSVCLTISSSRKRACRRHKA